MAQGDKVVTLDGLREVYRNLNGNVSDLKSAFDDVSETVQPTNYVTVSSDYIVNIPNDMEVSISNGQITFSYPYESGNKANFGIIFNGIENGKTYVAKFDLISGGIGGASNQKIAGITASKGFYGAIESFTSSGSTYTCEFTASISSTTPYNGITFAMYRSINTTATIGNISCIEKNATAYNIIKNSALADIPESALADDVVLKVDSMDMLFKDINTANVWTVGGLGSSGDDYDRSGSIRTFEFFSIDGLKEIVADEDLTAGYLCLYKDTGEHNGFLYRVSLSSGATFTREDILALDDETTRFRIEIGDVSNDLTKYSLIQIISCNDNDPLNNYKVQKQEADMMLLHKTGAETYGRCEFSAMIMSDIHNEISRANRIFSLMRKWGASYFDAFINCGDTVLTTYSTDLSWYDSAVSEIGVPHINVIGNHDAWSALNTLGEQSTAYSKIIAPLASQTGIVQPTDASTDSLCYYYIDLGTGVRVIALDCMFWDEDEASWLETVLADAKTDSKAVICVSHYGFGSTNMTQIPSLWREADVTTSDAINIVAAQKVKAFMDDGGTFICWLVGHVHGDNIHKLASYGNQLVLTFASPVQRASFIQKSDNRNDYNYTLATYLTVDKYYKTIRLLRIGADIDTWGIKHSGVALNYETGELIAAWS